VVAQGVGDIGGHADAAGRHDGQIGDGPFRPVLGHQHHPVAGLETQRPEPGGQRQDARLGLGPGQRVPRSPGLVAQERPFRELCRLFEEHGGQAGLRREVDFHASKLPLVPALPPPYIVLRQGDSE